MLYGRWCAVHVDVRLTQRNDCSPLAKSIKIIKLALHASGSALYSRQGDVIQVAAQSCLNPPPVVAS